MPLFRLTGKQLKNIGERGFRLEKDLQALTEANLESLFGLQFVTSEFERDGLRIDTLAFDPASSSFVIIEYKRDQSFSVVDQGFAYLSLMLNNKEVFLVEYNERSRKALKRDDVDWSQSRIVFIAKSFTLHQQAASGFKDLPIELWQVTRFEGDLVLYDRVQTRKSAATVKDLRPGNAAEQVIKQVKTYTEADVVPKEGKGRSLYEELRSRILQFDGSLHVHPTKTYVAFREGENWRNIFAVKPRSNKVQVDLYRTQPGDLIDPDNKIEYIKNSMEYWNQHVSSIDVTDEKDIEYTLYVLRQLLEKFRASQGV
jgi:predicted transport protein